MRGICTILRRELASYFTGPIGYIYLVSFLLFTNFLALFIARGKSFFELPVADMREYFIVLAGVSTFMVAAVTMRVWSEERKENTYEMLLTFPMHAWQLVLGKFFASLLFYALALAGTLTVPLMMVWLSRSGSDSLGQTGFWGLLDPGATASGYLGALLLGGVFIAFGLFLSSLCRDQIVAFVLTAIALFMAYILGTQWVKMMLDEVLAFLGDGVGSTIGDSIGIFRHFDYLARGLITGSGVLFFLVWTGIFLLLNGLAIERRGRPNSNLFFAASVILLIAIGGVGNRLLIQRDIVRVDVTEEKIHTIDPVSVEVLRKLDDVVSIRYVVSPRNKMPAVLQDLERDVRDKIESLQRASGGMLKFDVIYQEAFDGIAPEGEEEDDQAGIEERLLKKIQPFSAEVREDGKVSAQLIYSGLEISYGEKESEVLTPLSNENISGLEHTLVKFVHKITRDSEPVVALVAPMDRIDPQMAMIYQQMGRPVPPPDDPYQYLQPFLERENFAVRRVSLSEQEPLPEEYDVLAIVGPKELNERQQWEINRALANGKPVLLAVQKHVFQYEGSGGRYGALHQQLNPGVEKVLAASGLGVGDPVLMDETSTNLLQGVRTPFGMVPQPFPAEFRMHLTLTGDSLNLAHPVMKGVQRFRYVWGSPLQWDEARIKELGLSITTLARSEATSWTRSIAGEQLTSSDLSEPADSERGSRPLAVLVEGQFADAFGDGEAPAWPQPPMQDPGRPTPPATETPSAPQPGKLMLIGNAWLFHRDILVVDQHPDGIWFFVNAINFLNPDPLLQRINDLKYRTYQARMIPAIKPASQHAWKAIQFGGPLLVIAAAGVAVWLLRKRRRESYTASLRSGGEAS